MTKMKNTKKGMAKKALSISLVAAMLATSNVPVWAAFEADDATPIVVEAPAEEPVVVENEAPELYAVNSVYSTTIKDFKTSTEWGPDKTFTFKVKVTDVADNSVATGDMAYFWMDANGEIAGTRSTLGTPDAEGYASITFSLVNSTDVGNTYRLRVCDPSANDAEVYTSEGITVQKRTLTGTVNFTNGNANTYYTGKAITTILANEAIKSTIVYAQDGDASLSNAIKAADPTIDITDFTVTGKDIVNAYDVSGETLQASATIQSKLYRGTVQGSFIIWRKEIPDTATLEKSLSVALTNYEYEYTGSNIIIPKENIKITNLLTGNTLTGVTDDTNTGVSAVGEYDNVLVKPDLTLNAAKELKNFVFTPGYVALDQQGLPISSKLKIVKRDLTDTANTKITIKNVDNTLLQNGKINANALLVSNLVITDGEGNSLDALKNDLVIDFGTAGDLAVQAGHSYTVTVKSINANTIVGSRQVTFNVVAHDLETATLANATLEANLKAPVKYTGSQITKGITAENFAEKIGALVGADGKPLSPGVDYSTQVSFGENLNVGKGTIIIKGLGSWAGSEKVIEFNITQREVTKITVPEKVLYNSEVEEAKEYAITPTVEAEVTLDDGTKKTITVPASDYKVTYTWNGGKEPNGGKVVTSVVLTNTKSNFVFNPATLTGTTAIVNKAITDADIIMNQTTYTYTGANIDVDYKVVVDGVELEKNVDYIATLVNGKNVGEGTLLITGKGDYDNTTAKASFTITAADANDVVLEINKTYANDFIYDGTKKMPTINEFNITLNGNDVSSEFKLVYPTSKTANINAGEGTVTLVPVTNNKNFVGTKAATFTISPAQMRIATNSIKLYDANDRLVNQASLATTNPYDYTGEEITIGRIVYSNTGIVAPKVLTENDFEIIYQDNISGKAYGSADNRCGVALIVAKGNYQNTTTDVTDAYGTVIAPSGIYTADDESTIKNVIGAITFKINTVTVAQKNVTVENAVYASGYVTKPNVTVVVDGKTLTEGIDYELKFNANQNRINTTNGKTLDVTIVGKGAYLFGANNAGLAFKWGIDPFDFANAEVTVTDGVPTVKNGNIIIPSTEYDVTTNDDGTITISAKADSKNYAGSITVEVVEEEVLEAPAITASVERNMVDVTIIDAVDGATAYDYVLCQNAADLEDEAYFKSKMSVDSTTTQFQFVREGQYYVYARAAKRDENGKKVVSDWSVAAIINITCDTPNAPTVTKVTTSGNTVTVTYTTGARTEGVDLILGGAIRRQLEDDAMRPVNYNSKTGLIKNVPATTKTVTFTNVAKGTYFVGVHPYITSNDGLKYFGRWSKQTGITKVVVG